jgi:hypothetical protein
VEKEGIIQAGVGKASFSEEQLVGNIKALVGAVQKARPSGAKGSYMKRLAISSTMGPGVKLDISGVVGEEPLQGKNFARCLASYQRVGRECPRDKFISFGLSEITGVSARKLNCLYETGEQFLRVRYLTQSAGPGTDRASCVASLRLMANPNRCRALKR